MQEYTFRESANSREQHIKNTIIKIETCHCVKLLLADCYVIRF